MKKVLLVIMVLLLGACTNTVKVSDVDVTLSTSTIFSQNDLDDAVYTLKNHFKENYAGSELLKIQYEETEVLSLMEAEVKNDIKLGNIIFMFVDFKVGANNQNVTLTSGKTYTKYMFVLTRESKETNWKVIDSNIY